MKHADLIRALRELAKKHDFDLKEAGGTKHEKWLAGNTIAIVPRHKEIGEHLARKILKDFQDDLSDPTVNEEA